MSTVYDQPTPPPSDAEIEAFMPIYEALMAAMIRRFGHHRTMVILDDWHIEEVASAMSNGFEPRRRARILNDLNEALRLEYESDGFHEDGRPWVLIPTKEP